MTTLSVKQAADTLKMHYESVLLLIQDGLLPAAKIGRSWVLLEKDVMAFVTSQIQQQTLARRSRPIEVKDATTGRFKGMQSLSKKTQPQIGEAA